MATEQSESQPATATTVAAPDAAIKTKPAAETKTAPATDTTQQATIPAATTQRVKNPKRVAAGKMVAERSRPPRLITRKSKRKLPRLITRKSKPKPPHHPRHLSQPHHPRPLSQPLKAQRKTAAG